MTKTLQHEMSLTLQDIFLTICTIFRQGVDV